MSFWGSFTGNDQRDDLAKAKGKSDIALKQGYKEGQGYYDKAYGEFAPYAAVGAQGQADNDVYRQAIGLGTPDQQGAAQDRYFGDPAYARMMEPGMNALMRYRNARGDLGGGASVMAAGRLANEGYQGWLDRVGNVGQNALSTGLNASNARAGIRQGQGELAYGYGATKAGNAINYGNARAETRGIFSNNLLNLAGTAAKAYAGRPGA